MSASPAMQSFNRAWAARDAQLAAAPSPMRALRTAAMARFTRLGLPTLRDESWHYSNLRALGLRSFQTGAAPVAGTPPAQSWLETAGDFQVLHLVNGVPLAAGLNSHGPLQLQSLRALEQSDPSTLAALSAPVSDAETQRWLLLNTALFEDGLHIRIGGACQRPLLIVHHAVAAGAQSLLSPRVIIEAQANSSAVILEHHLGAAGTPFLCNSASLIRLQQGAQLEHYRVFSQSAAATHIDHVLVQAAADARLLQHTAVLGGGFVRVTVEASLDAAGASLDNHTLLTGHESRHTDCVNLVTHAAPHTQSRQTARIIAADRSRAIFNSKVTVAKGAQKADSLQSCRGLLLSAGAEIDTRPQLEIHADDVKCAHGATTGRLDPGMLFYLLSRGLDRRAAQSLLVFAFLADVLTDMTRPAVRAAIESELVSQLPDSQTLQQFR